MNTFLELTVNFHSHLLHPVIGKGDHLFRGNLRATESSSVPENRVLYLKSVVE